MSNGLLKPQHLCTHPNGFKNKDNRCIDCNEEAGPRARIETIHQGLLRSWASTQPQVEGGVRVPLEIVLSSRIEAHEQYLEEQHNGRRVVIQ